ncbi:MAG: hypothetical protein F6K09_04075 [Merismopedia sp. SIO2A8]|nr:hypothetical protein [Merismopedia sp. SIO2A8]
MGGFGFFPPWQGGTEGGKAICSIVQGRSLYVFLRLDDWMRDRFMFSRDLRGDRVQLCMTPP